ncbi:hypothetical protein C8R43DRAFT_1184479 [Mycena crocata]|nr:hypothetical protein C8R43DRAFT_1184479 [Mycena crocata]
MSLGKMYHEARREGRKGPKLLRLFISAIDIPHLRWRIYVSIAGLRWNRHHERHTISPKYPSSAAYPTRVYGTLQVATASSLKVRERPPSVFSGGELRRARTRNADTRPVLLTRLLRAIAVISKRVCETSSFIPGQLDGFAAQWSELPVDALEPHVALSSLRYLASPTQSPPLGITPASASPHRAEAESPEPAPSTTRKTTELFHATESLETKHFLTRFTCEDLGFTSLNSRRAIKLVQRGLVYPGDGLNYTTGWVSLNETRIQGNDPEDDVELRVKYAT